MLFPDQTVLPSASLWVARDGSTKRSAAAASSCGRAPNPEGACERCLSRLLAPPLRRSRSAYPRSLDLARWLYSWAMASTAATIVSGAVAERVHFRAYLWFVVLYAAFVYPMLVHWTWSPLGFLSPNADDRLFGCGVLEVAGCERVGGPGVEVAEGVREHRRSFLRWVIFYFVDVGLRCSW